MKEEKVKVKLHPGKVEMVVSQLNQILDNERIFGQEWNKQVIKELILQNLTKNTSIELIEELNETPISSWQD